MSVKCMLCGEEFGRINPTHLEFVHSITLDDYREMFPGAELVSEGIRQDLSRSLRGNQNALGNTFTHTEDALQKMSRAKIGKRYALGCVRTAETRQKMGEASTGNQCGLGNRGNTSIRTEKTKQSLSESLQGNQNFLGHVHTEKTCKQISESLRENWRDPEYAERMSRNRSRRPNDTELQLQSVLGRHFPNEWKYVGDGTFWLEGKNPDFMNVNGKKQLIEVFGYYWHDPVYFPNRLTEEELIAHYKAYGFDCLVFWEYDVYNEEEVVERVKDFNFARKER